MKKTRENVAIMSQFSIFFCFLTKIALRQLVKSYFINGNNKYADFNNVGRTI